MSLGASLCTENEFDFHETEPAGETYSHNNGLAPRLVMTQRQKVQRGRGLRTNLNNFITCK